MENDDQVQGLGECSKTSTALPVPSPRVEDDAPGSPLGSLSQEQARERPILFSGPMVRAILEGRKTQTRRIVKPQPVPQFGGWIGEAYVSAERNGVLFKEWGEGGHQPMRWSEDAGYVNCPYGKPGDRLWVRETWMPGTQDTAIYRAAYSNGHEARGWKPSIHMPRWASRITLEVVSVRVERLQWISEADARDEGCVIPENRIVPGTPFEYITRGQGQFVKGIYGVYAELWETINGSGSWDANPWVWVVEFRRVRDSSDANEVSSPKDRSEA